VGFTIKVSVEIVHVRTVDAEIALFEDDCIGSGDPVIYLSLKAPVLRVREDNGMAAVEDSFLTQPVNDAGAAADVSGEPVVKERKGGIGVQNTTVVGNGVTDCVINVGSYRKVRDFNGDRSPQRRYGQGGDKV
jgi:hypothetical protein